MIDLEFLHNDHNDISITEKNRKLMSLIISKNNEIKDITYILNYVLEHNETIHNSLIMTAKIASGGDVKQPLRLFEYDESVDTSEISILCDKIMKTLK